MHYAVYYTDSWKTTTESKIMIAHRCGLPRRCHWSCFLVLCRRRRRHRHSYNRQLPPPLPITRARCVITTLYIIHRILHNIILYAWFLSSCGAEHDYFRFFFRHNIFFLLNAIPQPLPARSRSTDFIPAAARLMSLWVFNDPPPQIMYIFVWVARIYNRYTCSKNLSFDRRNFNGRNGYYIHIIYYIVMACNDDYSAAAPQQRK